MTTGVDCTRAEILAGTLALGEASESDRDAYRRHVAGCPRCLANLGGERDIERVMAVVAEARDAEQWEPRLRAPAHNPQTQWRRAWSWAAALAAVAILSFAGQRLAEQRHSGAAGAGHALVVVHNVVTLPSAGDKRSIAAIGTQSAPKAEQRAESLAMAPAGSANRDVMPVGGDAAIVPHPPVSAYAQDADGTTAIEVMVDQHGRPLKCTIAESSGSAVLDDSVCRAAMRVRYTPRSVDGRAAMGTYRDAFTFRSNPGD
jgi:TonB family protein